MTLSAMELQLGVFGFLPTTWKQTQRKCVASGTAFHACKSSSSDRSTYAPNKSQLFGWQKNPITVQIGAQCEDKNGTGSGTPG